MMSQNNQNNSFNTASSSTAMPNFNANNTFNSNNNSSANNTFNDNKRPRLTIIDNENNGNDQPNNKRFKPNTPQVQPQVQPQLSFGQDPFTAATNKDNSDEESVQLDS